MRRRDFIAATGGVAAASALTAWPLAARAQQRALPVVGFIHPGAGDALAHLVAAFRKGLSESGYAEGQNVTVEYEWLEGQYDRVPRLAAEFVRRRVALIVTADVRIALAAKALTATIPILFVATEDPVKLGLVASLARPGGNLTGTNMFAGEVNAKRLGLLHELVPKAVRVGVLVNPAEAANTDATLQAVQEAARVIGLQIQVLKASTNREIDAAFAALAREPVDALFVGGDAFFGARRAQLVTLTARDRIPATYADDVTVAAGGLMSYGATFADTFHQIGVYAGQVLKGTKPSDLPVVQSTRFEFVINNQTARLLGIEVPPTLLAIADEVIE